MGNKECLHYLEQVRSELKGADRRKKEVLQQIQTAVEDYAEEHPQCTHQELTQHFGTPGQIAESYVAEMDSHEVLHGLRVGKKIFFAILLAIVLGVTAWLGYLALCFNEVEDAANGVLVPGEVTTTWNNTK